MNCHCVRYDGLFLFFWCLSPFCFLLPGLLFDWFYRKKMGLGGTDPAWYTYLFSWIPIIGPIISYFILNAHCTTLTGGSSKSKDSVFQGFGLHGSHGSHGSFFSNEYDGSHGSHGSHGSDEWF